jgi:hypothetical protein
MREMTRIDVPLRERNPSETTERNCCLRFLSLKKYCIFSAMLLLIFLMDASEMMLTLKQRAEELREWTIARTEREKLFSTYLPNETSPYIFE